MLSVVPGDIDLDGMVTGADFTVWADHFGSSGATWSQGDLNGDQWVTGADYTIWAENFGRMVDSELALAALGAGGAPGQLSLRRSGDRLEIHLNGELLLRPQVGMIESLTVGGSAGDDLLRVDLSAGDLGLSGGVHFDGGAGRDRLELQATSQGESIIVDAAALRLGSLRIGYSEVETLAVAGGAGDDSLTVQGATTADVEFDGGAGFDVLLLEGATFNDVVYTASGPNSGTIVRDGHRVAYDGIEPIDDTTVAASLTINATAAAETIQIVDGPVVATFQTTRVQSVSNTFELVNFANKTNVTVNGAGGGDTFQLSASLATPGLATLTLQGDGAADTFQITRTRGGTTTTIDAGGGADQIVVDGANLAGPLTVAGGAGSDTLTVNGTAGDDTFAVTATTVTLGASSPLTYSGVEDLVLEALAGNDTINVAAPLGAAAVVNGGASTTGDTLHVAGTAAADTFDLSGNALTVNAAPPLTFSLIEDLNLDGAGAADVLNVQGTAGADAFTLTDTRVTLAGQLPADYTNFETLNLQGLAGNDTFDVQSTAAGVTSNAQGGADDDTFVVAGALLAGALSVDGGPQGGSGDALTVNGTAAADTINITATTVTVAGSAATTYAAIELLSVQALGGDDTVNVAAPLTTPLGVDGGANNDALNVTGTAGNDTFDLAGNVLTVNASPAITFAAFEDLNLNAAGGAADVLDVQGTAGADAFTLTSARVTRAGSLPADYSGFETINLRGLANNDTFDIQSTAAGVASQALGGDGDDQFTVAGAALAGPLAIIGGNNADSLRVNASAGNDLIQVTNAAVQFSGAQATTYAQVESVRVDAFGGTDTVQVQSTAAGVAYQVNASTAQVEVQGGGLLGALTVDGMTSSTLAVLGTAAVDALTITAATISGFPAVLSYANVVSLSVDAQGDADVVTLNGTSAPTTILGGDGDDLIFVNAIAHATTVDAGQRNDVVTVEAGGLGAGLTALGGAQITNDLLRVNGTNGDDDFTITTNTVAMAGVSPTTYGGFEQLEVVGRAGADTFDVQSTLAGVATTILGNGGDDLVTVDGPNVNGPLTVSGLGEVNSLEVFGTAGADTFTLTATTVTLNAQPAITYDTTTQIVLHGLGGNDVFNVDSTPASSTVTLDGAAGLDAFNLRSTGAGSTTVVQGGADNDTIRIASLAPAVSGGVLDGNLNGIGGNVTIDAGSGANQLLVSDRTAALGNTAALVTANQITGLAGPTNTSTISFAAPGGSFSLLQIAGSDLAADTFDLRGPLAASVEVFTLGGGDTVLVRSTASGTSTVVNTGDGDDLVRVGSVPGTVTANQILGPLSVVGGAQVGQDRLIVDDSGETAATSATLSATAVSGMSPQPINFSQIEAVDLLFGSADDILTVDFTTGALPNLLALMGAGGDRVVVQSPPVGVFVGPVIGIPPGDTRSVQLPSSVQVDGGAGDDRVTLEGRDGVDDRLSVGVFGSLDSIQIQNVEYVRFIGRSGNDVMNNFTAACGFFEGGAGDDRMFGGSMTDVMFGGDGRDQLFGRDGDDFLLPDHDSNRTVHVVGGELADGGFGFDHVLAIGTALPDQVNSGEMISGFSFELDILTWLYGILTDMGSVLEQALAQECVKP